MGARGVEGTVAAMEVQKAVVSTGAMEAKGAQEVQTAARETLAALAAWRAA